MNRQTLLKLYQDTLKQGPTETADLVETLTHAQRIELRTVLEETGCKQLVRNLYYDYQKQVWI